MTGGGENGNDDKGGKPVDWASILRDTAVRLRDQPYVHPTLFVGPNLYAAAIQLGYSPEDLTLTDTDPVCTCDDYDEYPVCDLHVWVGGP